MGMEKGQKQDREYCLHPFLYFHKAKETSVEIQERVKTIFHSCFGPFSILISASIKKDKICYYRSCSNYSNDQKKLFL